MLKPLDVFAPGKIPLKKTNVYAVRGTKEDDFREAVERSLVPIVYGEYGVGKTSLARHNFKEKDAAGLLVNIESVAGKSFQDICDRILEKLQYTVTHRVVDTQTDQTAHEQSGGAEIIQPWGKASIGSRRTRSRSNASQKERELVIKSPTDSKLVEECEKKGVVLLLDELHRASPAFGEDLSRFIKTYGNYSCDKFKIALLGTASDATKLVRMDKGIDRLLQEVHLLSMDEDESRYLVEEGMRSLLISISEPQVKKLIKVSVGSPSILQYLCLEVSQAAFKRTPRIVDNSDIESAVRKFVETKEARLNKAYISAVETTGGSQYRKQILFAMSECEDEFVTMDYLSAKVTEYLGRPTPSTSLSGPLRDLKGEKYGRVLSDVERPDSEQRMYNYSTFTDPSLKAFIRMQKRRGEV
ncbi:MAG TPA: AAA family ATPase [Lysobacter sp.]